jgi:hypothetical protein
MGVSFSLIIGSGFMGFGLTKVMNVKLDHRNEYTVSAFVVDRKTEGKNNTPYIYVRAWKPGRGTERIKVSNHVFSEAIPRKSVAILKIKPGYFNFEWLVRAQIVSADSSDLIAKKFQPRVRPKINPAYYL